MMRQGEVHYSLGFNFDPALIDGVISANAELGGLSRIDEVFGALPDCPISSARPTSRLSHVSWAEFANQVEKLRSSGIAFNFLMNTAQRIDSTLARRLNKYLGRLLEVGVQRLTVGTPALCCFVKDFSPHFHVILSITYGIRSKEQLSKAEAAGADSVYLDGVHVNRNFELLRSLLRQTVMECRLYANMSCISVCPVVRGHYRIFSGPQTDLTAHQNDAFFFGCTLVKLNNSVEWIQMPWIRPEDIPVYLSEGVSHFKLADRLAPTETLLTIVRSYLKGVSPDNLFVLMERDGPKYKMFSTGDKNEESTPILVASCYIPDDFIEHFRSGMCKSNNVSCKVCSEIARKAVHIAEWLKTANPPIDLEPFIPPELCDRAHTKILKQVGSDLHSTYPDGSTSV